MSEEISDAGHGPSRGFSGMNDHIKRYLEKHPAHKDEQKSRSRCLGRTILHKKRKHRAARRYKGQR